MHEPNPQTTEQRGRVQFPSFVLGAGAPLVLIAGPCVIESRSLTIEIARALHSLCQRLNMPLIFKASYDKANRSSVRSFRGPGLKRGLEVLAEIKESLGVPILADIHCRSEVEAARHVLDVIQIPAFLCRQTDLIIEAAQTNRVINVKKGQFMAPWDMRAVLEKIASTRNSQILVTERGCCFGYNNLVVDFRSLVILKKIGVGVVFDVTHSVQLPGGRGDTSGGQREYVPYLARAATAVGIDALFMEVHPDPDCALCDGPNAMPLSALEELLKEIIFIDVYVKKKSA
jgi:2-dehydro-3-deoxyphosphooctonate aldolase (KDO 8-P synthase)